MMLDRELLFSSAQAVTATADSTDTIDLGAANADLGKGEEIEFLVTVTEAFTAGGAATLTIAWVTDNAAGFGSSVALYTSGAVALAGLTLGATPVKVRVPRGTRRYNKLVYTVATGPMTAGKVTAGILIDVDDQQIYPRAAYAVA